MIQFGAAPPGEIMNLAEGFEDAESENDLCHLSGCSAVTGVDRYGEM